MHTRRTFAALMTATLLSVLATAPVSAAKPTRPPSQPPPPGERPLTDAELDAANRKLAEAQAFLASPASAEGGFSTLSCATPTASSGADATTDATVTACYVPQAYLPVEARDQIRGHYCGPAVGQVISNYSWAMRSGANRYSQGTIAGWMKTDLNGGTSAYDLASGLNAATGSSPRRPANFAYVVTSLQDTDGDGTVGDQLQDYVRTAVSHWKMPLAIAVKPHDPNARYNLYSWPNAVLSPGHWIAAYGWYSYWTGSEFARIYYTDSSRDEGGSTGKFWNPTLHIATMIMEHTRRFVW